MGGWGVCVHYASHSRQLPTMGPATRCIQAIIPLTFRAVSPAVQLFTQRRRRGLRYWRVNMNVCMDQDRHASGFRSMPS